MTSKYFTPTNMSIGMLVIVLLIISDQLKVEM